MSNSTALVAVVVLIVVVAGIAAAALWRSRPRPTIIAVLKDGQTIRGVLLRRRVGQLELADAELLTGDGQKIAADGRVFIYRDNVNWLQRPGG